MTESKLLKVGFIIIFISQKPSLKEIEDAGGTLGKIRYYMNINAEELILLKIAIKHCMILL